jgi:hypothetical protein
MKDALQIPPGFHQSGNLQKRKKEKKNQILTSLVPQVCKTHPPKQAMHPIHATGITHLETTIPMTAANIATSSTGGKKKKKTTQHYYIIHNVPQQCQIRQPICLTKKKQQCNITTSSTISTAMSIRQPSSSV